MNKKNLLIVGATSGIMVSCLEKFLNEDISYLPLIMKIKAYKIFLKKLKSLKISNFLNLISVLIMKI